MGFPNHNEPFILYTDASNDGLGAVLYQEQRGKRRVIAYGSRTMSPAEKNYNLHSGKLKFLALKWAVTEKFRDHFYYAPSFKVYTDNNPQTYILTTAKLNATGQRWVAELADYNFTIKYLPGKRNGAADALSRMPLDFDEYQKQCTQEVSTSMVQATVQAIQLQSTNHTTWINTIATSQTDLLAEMMTPAESATSFTRKEIRQAQEHDHVIAPVLKAKRANTSIPRKERRELDCRTVNLLHEWKLDDDGILHRKTRNRMQLILPTEYRQFVLQQLHNEMGYLGAD